MLHDASDVSGAVAHLGRAWVAGTVGLRTVTSSPLRLPKVEAVLFRIEERIRNRHARCVVWQREDIVAVEAAVLSRWRRGRVFVYDERDYRIPRRKHPHIDWRGQLG